jgi:hypothetical protein
MREAAGRSEDGERAGRWSALDLLRFCAVFLMVQGHTFTELLEPAVRTERWFRHHNFVHGYTAPMFLFASGLAFGYTTFRAWDQNLRIGDPLWKRFRRYGWLLLVGYALHLPTIDPGQFSQLGPAQIRTLLHVDVLQHIGVSLAICQVLVLVLRKPERFAAVVGVLFVLAVLAAPIVARWDAASVLPMGVAGFVNEAEGSLFPLVPWAGFTYAGILCAYFARHARSPSKELAWPFAVAASIALLVPIAINHTGWNPYGVHDFWRTSPYYFFWRLGNVLAVLALLCFFERWIDRSKVGASRSYGSACSAGARPLLARGLSLVRAVGQQSLIVYVAHLLVLHGSVLNDGMKDWWGPTLSLAEASAVALGLFLAMVALAKGWTELQQRELRDKAVQLATTSALVYALLLG